jgi:hypothetical protein
MHVDVTEFAENVEDRNRDIECNTAYCKGFKNTFYGKSVICV